MYTSFYGFKMYCNTSLLPIIFESNNGFEILKSEEKYDTWLGLGFNSMGL